MWWALTVYFNYGGRWSGLFCTGGNQRVPFHLLAEDLYTEKGSYGYDGQFYHYIAHDPLGRTPLHDYVDAPRLRYRRILVPAVAYLLAGGQSRWIDASYYATVLFAAFMGIYWIARFAQFHKRSVLWGWVFLPVPAVLVSIDRMTVDVALAAICAGVVLNGAKERHLVLWLLLAAAPLVRETGLALTAAYCLWVLVRREWRNLAIGVLTVVPFLAWLFYVHAHFPSYAAHWAGRMPFGDFLGVIFQPFPYPWSAAKNAIVLGVDYLGLAGAVLAAGMCLRLGLSRDGGLLSAMLLVGALVGAGAVAFGGRDVLVHCYGYARVLSPLFLLCSVRGIEVKRWSYFAPTALVLPRIGLQVMWQILGIARGLARLVPVALGILGILTP
jgi:hypothetical protein